MVLFFNCWILVLVAFSIAVPHTVESQSRRSMAVDDLFEIQRVGDPQISPDGNTADVPFLFGPDGDQEETMVLIRRNGRWYLLQF